MVVAFPIIPAPLLQIPPLGTVNLHASLLPRYRGAAPVQRAIMAGEERTGVTTFFIDAGVDTGAICRQQEVDIEPGETSGELSARLSHIGAQLMLETLAMVRSGDPPRAPQDAALASPAPRLSKEEGRLIWSEDARTLVNRIRGTNPWPGAFTFAAGERLLVHRADPIAAGEVPWTGEVEPGTVAAFTDDGSPIVAAGDGGGVVLLELQRGGRKASSGADVSRGLRWRGGEQLRDD